ncbi:MAG: ORF6N domain-containing protein [Desulfobacterales bacterium]|nr:ORF6N domain-containing protein [Desulfobacterales bacterium]
MNENSMIPVEGIDTIILVIRGQKVILDRDLAQLYGVTIKRLNEQVKRNRDRFPEDFMFRLRAEEKEEVVANCDHLSTNKFSAALPNAFTENGAIMVASIINSPRAIEASIFVVSAYVKCWKHTLSYCKCFGKWSAGLQIMMSRLKLFLRLSANLWPHLKRRKGRLGLR